MRIIKARGLLKLIYLFAGIVQIAAIFSAFEKPAYAYVDPGSGYLLLQIAGSMLAGAAFFVRHRLKRMLGLAVDSDSSPPPQSGPIRDEK